MKNKTIIWSVVGIVVVAGLVWFFVGRSSSPTMTNSVAGTSQSGTGSPMTMTALLAAGTSQQCTFSNTASDGTQTSGTVFVTSGHMRGDFTSQSSAGQTMTSHMITDGTTSWIWTDQQPTEGMEMSFAGMGEMNSTTSAGTVQAPGVDPTQQMNYSCSGWTPDQSEFTLPTNVTFNDMSALMGGAVGADAGAGTGPGAGQGGGSNAAMCSACNQISNASQKAQCLAAMGC